MPPPSQEKHSRLPTTKPFHHVFGLKNVQRKPKIKDPSKNDDSHSWHSRHSHLSHRDKLHQSPFVYEQQHSSHSLSDRSKAQSQTEPPLNENPRLIPFPNAPKTQPKNPKSVLLKVKLKPNSSKSFAGIKFTMKSSTQDNEDGSHFDTLHRRSDSKVFHMKKLNTLCDDDSNLMLKEPLFGQNSEISPYISAYRRKTNFKSDVPFDRHTAFPSSFDKGSQVQNPCCQCRNSQCLKLYCECFKTFGFCNEACKCVDCLNRNANSDRRSAVNKVLNSKYGRTKFKSFLKEQPPEVVNSEDFSTGVVFSVVKLDDSGCQCRKSYCNNKYCSCHSAGKKCSVKCQCIECLNK